MNLREYLFTAEEQQIIDDIFAVLKPMKRATAFVSAEKQPTASRILPTIAKLRLEMTVNENTDSKLMEEMKVIIVDNLNKRYIDQNVRSFLLTAGFLDPRYKSLNNIATEGAVLNTKQAVKEMCLKVAESMETEECSVGSEQSTLPSLPASAAAAVKEEPQADRVNPHSTDTESSTEPPQKKIKLESEEYDDWLNDVIYVGTHEEAQNSHLELINKELEKYDAELQIKGDPLQWWKSRESSMPFLAEVAKSVLCVPGSSVPSERVFSKSGQLLNKRRASLKSKNVNMLVFLNKNYPFKYVSE